MLAESSSNAGSQYTAHRSRTRWLTPRQAASRTGYTVATIRKHARLGRLPGYKLADGRVWRFRPEDVDCWCAGWRTEQD